MLLQFNISRNGLIGCENNTEEEEEEEELYAQIKELYAQIKAEMEFEKVSET